MESPIDATGMACHIYATADGKGAKRYKKDMTTKLSLGLAKNTITIDNTTNGFENQLIGDAIISEKISRIKSYAFKTLIKPSRSR